MRQKQDIIFFLVAEMIRFSAAPLYSSRSNPITISLLLSFISSQYCKNAMENKLRILEKLFSADTKSSYSYSDHFSAIQAAINVFNVFC